jgi:hypothetical protein
MLSALLVVTLVFYMLKTNSNVYTLNLVHMISLSIY